MATMTAETSDYPQYAVPWTGSSGKIVNGDAQATSGSPPAGMTAFIRGFMVTSAGASVPQVVTVTGVVDGPLSFMYGGAPGAPMPVPFGSALMATDKDTAITVDCPALGVSSVGCCVVAHGYFLGLP